MAKELNTLSPKKWVANYSDAKPTIDVSNGVRVGDIAVDTSTSPNEKVWTCYDNTAGSPVWYRGNPMSVCYLTYDNAKGTPSGTNGCTFSGNGVWTITEFNSIYYCDDALGSLTITIPDASNVNQGQTLAFVKPRLVQSDNLVTIKTVSGQQILRQTEFKLYTANDSFTIVSVPFSANGSLTYKYRQQSSNFPIHEVLNVAPEGNQLYTNIKDAVDFANNYTNNPVVIQIAPGDYYVDETIVVNSPYHVGIHGGSPESTTIYNGPTISNQPIFGLLSSIDLEKMTFVATGGYGAGVDECALCSKSQGLYVEIHAILIYGFYNGINIEGPTSLNSSSSSSSVDSSSSSSVDSSSSSSSSSVDSSESSSSSAISSSSTSSSSADSSSSSSGSLDVQTEWWIFDSIIDNCNHAGIYCNGGSFGVSEVTIGNNNVGIDIVGTSNFNRFSITNTIFQVNTGQIGVRWSNVASFVPQYHFATGNAFFGTGTYISGFDFNDPLQAGFSYVNNLGLREFKPTAFTEFVANAATTTMTNQNDYYKVQGTNTGDSFGIKYLIGNNQATYLEPIDRYFQINAVGEVEVNANGQNLKVALYKNGVTKLAEITVRCTTQNTGYPFSLNKMILLSQNDYIELYVANTTSAGKLAIVSNMGNSILSL